MPQFFAPIIAGLRFPGKSRGIGRMRGEVRTGSGWVRWCALEGLYTGSVEWGECAGRHSGTSAILGRVVFWRTPADWGNAGEYEVGVAGCGGMRWRGCIHVWRGGESVRGGALARLQSWGGGSGGLGELGYAGGERRLGVAGCDGMWRRGCVQAWWGEERVGSGRWGERNRVEGHIPPAGHQKSTLIRGCFLLCAYSKKPKSEKGKMVNTARLMTSSASI